MKKNWILSDTFAQLKLSFSPHPINSAYYVINILCQTILVSQYLVSWPFNKAYFKFGSKILVEVLFSPNGTNIFWQPSVRSDHPPKSKARPSLWNSGAEGSSWEVCPLRRSKASRLAFSSADKEWTAGLAKQQVSTKTSHGKSWSFSVSGGIPIWDEEGFDGTQHPPAQGKKARYHPPPLVLIVWILKARTEIG